MALAPALPRCRVRLPVSLQGQGPKNYFCILFLYMVGSFALSTYAHNGSTLGQGGFMYPLLSLAVGLILMAPAALHVLRDMPRIKLLGTPWTPLPLYAISGYPGNTAA